MVAEIFNFMVGAIAVVIVLGALLILPLWAIRKYWFPLRAWYLEAFGVECTECWKRFHMSPNVCPQCQIDIAVKAAQAKIRSGLSGYSGTDPHGLSGYSGTDPHGISGYSGHRGVEIRSIKE